MLLTTLFYCFHNTGKHIRLMVHDCVNNIEQRLIRIKYGCSGYSLASQVVHWGKNLPAVQETQERWVWFLGLKDPLEEGTVTHSSILAWRIPWTEEPGGVHSIASQRVEHDWSNWACAGLNSGSPKGMSNKGVGGHRGGRQAQEWGETYIFTADSSCCGAETNTTL